MKELFEKLIKLIGEDPKREGLLKTPERAAEAYQDLTFGYQQDPVAILQKAVFKSPDKSVVIIKDIEFYSLCEHHLLPFSGLCHIGYIPDGKIIGLSKFARLTDVFARRLQVQEHLTSQIANCINDVVKPKGVAVLMEAEHACMRMRGVGKQHSVMSTVVMLGKFEKDSALRAEFLAIVKGEKK